jgi:hypothetical protein
MSEENGNNGKNTTDSETSPQTPEQPQKVNPMGDEALERLRKKLPPSVSSGIELEGTERNAYDVLGTEIGLGQEKNAPTSHAIPDKPDPYQWLERSSLTNEEIDVFKGEIAIAEHGIGGDLLDIPIIEIAEDVIVDLRARRSRIGEGVGQSSERFEREMTAWLSYLRQKEDEKLKNSQKNIGS